MERWNNTTAARQEMLALRVEPSRLPSDVKLVLALVLSDRLAAGVSRRPFLSATAHSVWCVVNLVSSSTGVSIFQPARSDAVT